MYPVLRHIYIDHVDAFHVKSSNLTSYVPRCLLNLCCDIVKNFMFNRAAIRRLPVTHKYEVFSSFPIPQDSSNEASEVLARVAPFFLLLRQDPVQERLPFLS